MPGVTLLEVDRLTVRFRGLTAVDGVNLAVAEGEFVAIIGPNGAGKTTLFNVIAGSLRPSAGDVRFAGRSVAGLGAARMSQLGVGRTFQVARPFVSLTVRENVRLAAGRHYLANPLAAWGRRGRDREVEARVNHLLAVTGLAGLADRRAGDLNMGGLRRLEIARALALEPRLLLLDEPAAGLGIDGIRPLAELIRALRSQHLTVLLVEHHVGFALSLCDRVVVLDQGKKIFEGTPEAVRRDERVITAYLGESGGGEGAMSGGD